LRVGGKPDRLGCRRLATVAGALHGGAPRRFREHIETEGSLVARKRLDVGDHHVLVADAGRPDPEIGITARVHAAIAPHAALERRLVRERHVAHERHQPDAGVALGEVEARKIPLKIIAVDPIGRLEQTPQPDQQIDVVLEAPVQRSHGLRNLVMKLCFGLAADSLLGNAPGGKGDHQSQCQHEIRRHGLPDPSDDARQQAAAAAAGLHSMPRSLGLLVRLPYLLCGPATNE